MTQQMHLLGESIQEVTLRAWPTVYGEDNKYDQDSREVLRELRGWAEEFEKWWQSHDEVWKDITDYVIEVWRFTDKKVEEDLKRFE